MSAAPVAVRAMAMLGNRALPSVLDLDDNENIRAERMAELHKNYGNTELAAHELRELPNLRRFQKLMLPRFSVSLLAGSGDRDIFAAEHPSIRFVRLPNVVRLPPPVRNQSSEPFSLLFLGTLCYLPNEDALSLFCDSIVPKILERKPHVNLRVAGTNATARVRALANREGVTFVGTVPDVSTEYERCGAVVVPLRGGSGTRIKILEAFSYRRPVVSTSLGAEGLGTVHGEHLLIADTPDEVAAACLRLLEDADLRGRLVENAYQWLLATHSIDRAREVLHSLYPAVG
jgi:glycosyltransferase involved in cell wall biosynthesis